MSTKNKIKIDGKVVAWKIFQIPSLAMHYKSFLHLREESGHDSLLKGGVLNPPDEIHYHKETIMRSYSLLPKNYRLLRGLRKFFTRAHDIFKMCLDDEALFCYFYTKGDIYIDKKTDGLNDDIEKIAYLESDSETKLFVSKSNSDIMPFLKKDKWGFKKQGKLIVDCIYDDDYLHNDTFF